MKPIVKLTLWPLIFMLWIGYRIGTVRYVDSPSFIEFWEDL